VLRRVVQSRPVNKAFAQRLIQRKSFAKMSPSSRVKLTRLAELERTAITDRMAMARVTGPTKAIVGKVGGATVLLDFKEGLKEILREGMERTRREWVRGIRAGSMPNWKPLSKATRKKRLAQGYNVDKPAYRTGSLLKQMENWDIRITESVDVGGRIVIRATLVPPRSRDTRVWAIPQDIFMGHHGTPEIPARPLHVPTGVTAEMRSRAAELAREFARRGEVSLLEDLKLSGVSLQVSDFSTSHRWMI
jgi:hypothetical protein